MARLAFLASALLMAAAAAQDNSSSVLRGSAVAVNASSSSDKAWYTVDADQGQSPWNAKELGGNKITLTVKPYEEAVRVTANGQYTGGSLLVKVKSASVTPGIITSIYLASGKGRTSDASTGKQDEIDLEWKGNDPTHVQTNVFLSGQEDLQLLNVGGDSSASERLYGISWDDTKVQFSIDGQVLRSKPLLRPLAPMKLQIAVWTTMGGWPGLIQWGGSPDWQGRNNAPVTATFEIVQFPNQ